MESADRSGFLFRMIQDNPHEGVAFAILAALLGAWAYWLCRHPSSETHRKAFLVASCLPCMFATSALLSAVFADPRFIDSGPSICGVIAKYPAPVAHAAFGVLDTVVMFAVYMHLTRKQQAASSP